MRRSACPRRLGCELLTDASMTSLAQCHRLQSIALEGCEHITTRGLVALLIGCPSLPLAGLRGVARELVTDDVVVSVVQHHPMLQFLDLSFAI